MTPDRETGPRVVFVVVDGLPVDLADDVVPSCRSPAPACRTGR
jgi:hypothetical protein